MAEGTELGKAYVQIIPSARGIGAKLREELGGAPAQAGEAAGQSMGSRMAGAIKTAIAAAGIGAAFSKALNEGAALEQSIGGVETLFKDSADTIKKYAADAYKTAGVSANSYMEQVTSFSATLLQGLGGDTAAAAKYANKAIVQMSDNANKMGTDISSIQMAYQGFAKDNYTMLDNLKLGYGGTQSEMARLINDSGVLGDSIKVTAETVRDVPFDKVIEAIGVIQDELGITGTTAKEAATTISGSMASVKAAFSNVLANLTLGQDIQPALNGLAETVTTFLLDNLLPAVGNILRGLPSAIGTFISGAAPQISASIGQTLSGISPDLGGLWQSISGKLGGIWAALPGVMAPLQELFSSMTPLLQGVMSLADAALGKIQQALEALGPVIEAVTPVLQGLFDSIGNFLQGHANELISALAGIAAGFAVFKTITTIVSTITLITSGIGKLIGVVKTAGSVMGVLKAAIAALGGPVTLVIAAVSALVAGFIYLWNTCEPFKQFWIDLGTNIANFVRGAAQAVVNFFTVTLPGGIQNAITFIQQLPGKIAAFFSQIPYMIGNFLGQALGTLASWAVQLPQLAMQAASTFLSNVTAFFSELPENILSWLTTALHNVTQWAADLGRKGIDAAKMLVSNVVDGIKALPGKLLDIGRQAIEGLWNGIQNAAGWLRDQISGFVSGIIDGFTSAFRIGSPSRVMRDKVGHWIAPGIAEGITGNMKSLRSAMGEVRDTIAGQLGSVQAGLSAALHIDRAAAVPWSIQPGGNVQNIYFEQPMQAPDEIARALRIQQQYGLAGAR